MRSLRWFLYVRHTRPGQRAVDLELNLRRCLVGVSVIKAPIGSHRKTLIRIHLGPLCITTQRRTT